MPVELIALVPIVRDSDLPPRRPELSQRLP
jgi:hypothetical protein